MAGYRVDQHEINDKAKTLKLWVRRKRGNRRLVCSDCGRKPRARASVELEGLLPVKLGRHFSGTAPSVLTLSGNKSRQISSHGAVPPRLPMNMGSQTAPASYRHAHAFGLFAKRQRNIRAALEKIIEKAGGRTKQKVVYGGLDYQTGKLTSYGPKTRSR